MKYLILEVSSY